MENGSQKLGEVLFAKGLVDQGQLLEALEAQKVNNRLLGEVLVEKGWVEGDKLNEILAGIFQVPFVHITDTIIQEEALSAVPYDLMQSLKILPLTIDDTELTIATNNPLDVNALQEIQYKSGLLIKPVMASLHEIEDRIQEYSDSIHSIHAIRSGKTKIAATAPVVQLIDSLIRRAIKEKASDIHFEPYQEDMRVRFRIDGVLYEKTSIEKPIVRNVISRIKIMSGMDVAESRRPQDGRMSYSYAHADYDIRISTLPSISGEIVVMRILNKKFVNRSFESLGMDQDEAKLMSELIKRPYGLVLVTGPTGAGKTTTLYSILNSLNQPSKNIISIEDPIEYELEGINQTSSNHFTGYTFSNAMRHILRQDPDIIMIGEIRDVETAEAAIRAALTGHLVLATMHTNDAAGAITRLLEMNIEPFLISSSIIGVVAQRLLRTLCTECKEGYIPGKEIVDTIQEHIEMKGHQTLARSSGCEHCLNTGFTGRIGIYEILKINQEMKRMIIKNADQQDIVNNALAHGMKTLRMASLVKVAQHVTTVEEAMQITAVE